MATPRKLTVTDAHLAEALAGRAYLLFDGGMGTLVQAAGLHTVHEVPDLLNLTHPEAIVAIQRQYVEAGADCITTNTFNTNRLKLANAGATVAEVYAAAAANARVAGAPLVAGDIGPTGALLEPLGTLTFDEAFDIFSEQARAAEAAGCDLIVVETMADLLEAKAAVLAAVESTTLPVFATMTFGEDGRTFLGTTPDHIAALRALIDVRPLPAVASVSVPAHTSVASSATAVSAGSASSRVAWGEQSEPKGLSAFSVPNLRYCPAFAVTSAQQMVSLPEGEARIAVIGERINPTGKKKLKAALQAGDVDYLVAEAAAQQRAGADILDVNVGVPGLDEPALLSQVTRALQATVPLPLQLDSSDPAAIEAAARAYAGRPMVNSVNGKADNLATVLPVVARYGCTVVGLTLDENGIPPTAEERLAIAERIVAAAEAHGIPREDVAIDCLVMAAATNQDEVREILRAVTLVKERLGVRTVLGVSNVSFGLPARPLVNSTFLAAAFGAGLDMPILNPLNVRYRDTVATFRILNGQDAGCRAFLEAYANTADPYEAAAGISTAGVVGGSIPVGGDLGRPSSSKATPLEEGGASTAPTDGARNNDVAAGVFPVGGDLGRPSVPSGCPIPITETFADVADAVSHLAECVLEGRGTPVAAAAEQLLETHDGLAVINDIFVPVLDVVGQKYDEGVFFLPQLMASAEAVKAGFDLIRDHTQAAASAPGTTNAAGDRAIIVATVQGDIHDIGKNIVKMLLENYGFTVIDLGRDVAPEAVLAAARDTRARLIGLSALMTTTVGAMERTIQLIHEQLPGTAVMVGGAVITQEFADQIGADFYAKDAAASTRVASAFFDD